MTDERKVAICTPIHRDPTTDFVASLFRALQGFPAETSWFHVVGHANLARARNYLVAQARDWGATDIVMVDSDIGFEPEAMIALFETDAQVVGGCPQRRDDHLGFCGIPDVPVACRADQLISGHAATAFTRIDAAVFDKLEPIVPTFAYNGRTYPAFFEVGIRGGEMLDEDVWFSRLCRDNDITVWLDPTIRLRHWHSVALTEVMADHLTFTAASLKEAS